MIYFLRCLYLISFLSLNLSAANQKTIGIFTYHGPLIWDLNSINQGIVGSEEAVIYMSQELAKLGYQVTVLGTPPINSPYRQKNANPRFIAVEEEPDLNFDIAISWRQPFNALQLKKRAKEVYLWPHDTYHNPLSESQIQAFDDVLWLSDWQRKQWISVNPSFEKFTKIFGNGLMPEQFGEVKVRENPHSCIYGSNYARGLEVLLKVWPNIKKQFPNATLDIYYGWQHWGLMSYEKEQELKTLVKEYSKLDVRENGLVGHQELAEAYKKASVWAYPCWGWETFCITALKAQLAGAIPAIIEGSALPETVKHGFSCKTVAEYEETLVKALKHAENISLEERKKYGDFILQNFTWQMIAKKWSELFEEKQTMLESVKKP